MAMGLSSIYKADSLREMETETFDICRSTLLSYRNPRNSEIPSSRVTEQRSEGSWDSLGKEPLMALICGLLTVRHEAT